MKTIATLLSLLFATVSAMAGGILDLSRPVGAPPVGILIAESVDRIGVVAIATTGYGELFVGRRFTAGQVNITAYAGGEYLAGLGVKPRVRLVSSASVGDFSLLSIIESKGHTGNFNKTVLGYAATESLSISAVRLNGKNGGRIDLNLGVVNPYIEVVDRKATASIAIVF
jgi:hypothetical protein